MKNNKLIFIFLLCLTSIVFSRMSNADSCQGLIGEWAGLWNDLEQVQRANIHFLTLQEKQYSGFYTLENGQQGKLNGSCTEEDKSSGHLIFVRTPPFYNPCYGQLITDNLAIWCVNPNQSGTFKKI